MVNATPPHDEIPSARGNRARRPERDGRRRCFALPSVLLALVLSAPAAAEAPPPRNLFLEEGKRQIFRDRPEAAVDELGRAMDIPGVPEEQIIEILAWLGAALYLARDEIEAERVWERRVRLDPLAVPPRAFDEEMARAFERVRERTVLIRHEPPGEAFAGIPLSLEAALVDHRDRTADLLVYSRRAGEPGYQVTAFEQRGERWSATVAPPPLAGSATRYDLEYYLVAQAETGEILHSLGDAGEPLTLLTIRAPEEMRSGPRHQRHAAPAQAVSVESARSRDDGRRRHAWVWGTMLGACVLVAGGAVFMVLGGPAEADLPSTSLGTIHYPMGSED